jgi:ubiquinone/menaquinone biosynthesis C-methylase UbiE
MIMAHGSTKHRVEPWDRAWDKRQAPPNSWHQNLVESIIDEHGNIQNKRILEIGAGTAKDSLCFAELQGNVTAIDISAYALRLAQEGKRQRGVDLNLAQADLFSLPFAFNAFDIVFSQGVIEHFADPILALSEHVRVLRPEGILLGDITKSCGWHEKRGGVSSQVTKPEPRPKAARRTRHARQYHKSSCHSRPASSFLGRTCPPRSTTYASPRPAG